MFAIVEISGKQFRVSESDKLYVPLQDAQAEASVTFDRVLLVADGDAVHVGTPVVEGAEVSATVLDHVKADKVLVFKKKRRKRFRVKRGHRQPYTQIRIEGVSLSGNGKAKASAKKAEAKPADKPAEEKKQAPAKASKAASKGDDLTRIEGVGPKYASILAEGGLDSYAKIAESTPDAIKEVLTEAGSRYGSADTSTWPEQAALAAAGDWDALKTLQDELSGGRRS